MSRDDSDLAIPGDSSYSGNEERSKSAGSLSGKILSNRPPEAEQPRPSRQESLSGLWGPTTELVAVSVAVGETGEVNKHEDSTAAGGSERNIADKAEYPEETAHPVVPFDKRPSYLRISRRLDRIRVVPALAACFSALLVTSAICGAQLVVGISEISSPLALLSCSVLACILAVVAARTKSHVLLVGLVLLEVLFTSYAIAFASVGLVNVKLLKQRQDVVWKDGTLQEEQRENALKILRRMLIEEAVFSGLYFLVAAAHCYAAASANHLRAAVRPFDSRLRRKRQRARAFRKLGVAFGPEVENGALRLAEQGAKAIETPHGNEPDEKQGGLDGAETQVEQPEAYQAPALGTLTSSGPLDSMSPISSSRNRSSSYASEPEYMAKAPLDKSK